jgi:hypothetical protein
MRGFGEGQAFHWPPMAKRLGCLCTRAGEGDGSGDDGNSPWASAAIGPRAHGKTSKAGCPHPRLVIGSAHAPNVGPDTGRGEGTVGRSPGLSVRLKFALSYAGSLMLAGARTLLNGLRYVPRVFITDKLARSSKAGLIISAGLACGPSRSTRGSGAVRSQCSVPGGSVLSIALSFQPPAVRSCTRDRRAGGMGGARRSLRWAALRTR